MIKLYHGTTRILFHLFKIDLCKSINRITPLSETIGDFSFRPMWGGGWLLLDQSRKYLLVEHLLAPPGQGALAYRIFSAPAGTNKLIGLVQPELVQLGFAQLILSSLVRQQQERV